MKLLRLIVLTCCAALLAAGAGGAGAQDEEGDMAYRLVAYYASWDIYARQYFVTDIPADLITHINYAFFNVSPDGECVLGDEWADTQFPYPDDPEDAPLLGNFRQFQLLKEAHPHLQVLMAVGGWTWSDHFSDLALTADSRARFIESCVEQMTRYGFDGIDVDWEYPVVGGEDPNAGRPEDRENFTALLAEFRAALDAQGEADGRHYLLTIASAASPHGTSGVQLDQIHQHLDWINVMAYDFYGGWSSMTNFHAPLYASSADPANEPDRSIFNADAAVRMYLDAGVPADKIVLGVPFYARAWAGVPPENNGLYQPFTGLPDVEGGVYTYKQVAFYAGLSIYTRYWHEEAQAAWLYNEVQGVMISYEDPQALAAKAAYVQEHGLGGLMLWALGNDDDEHTLLYAMAAALNGG